MRSSKGTVASGFYLVFNLSWSFYTANDTFKAFLSPSQSTRSPSRARSPRFPILPPTTDRVTRKKESKRKRSEGGRGEGQEGGVKCSREDGEVEVGPEA